MKKLCVLFLAAGIGLTVALASIADAIFFRPLPVPDADRMVRIPEFVSYPDFEDFKRARNVTDLVGQTQVLLAIGDAPRQVKLGLAVTGDYFDALGIRAAHGRVFHESEARDPVVVLAAGADPATVGRELRIGSARFRVLGIAPAGFGLDRFVHESFYIPMRVFEAGILPGSEHVAEDRGRRFLSVMGRLAPGARIEQARAEMSVIAARLAREFPRTNRNHTATVRTEMESRLGGNPPIGPFAWLFVAMGGVITLVASANAGGLVLARAEAGSKEIALKLALGATRARLLREFALESIGVVLAGAGLGLPLAWAAAKGLARVATLPTDFSFSIAPGFDARIALVLAIAMAIPILICGCAPVILARRIELGAALKQSSSKWRGALVAAEIALAGTLAIMGAALTGGVRKARSIDPGYRVDHVVVMAIDPVQNGYSREQTRVFFDTLLERVRTIPGVRRAALAQSAVLGYMRAPARVEIEAARDGETLAMWMNTITPGYFALMRLPLTAGRDFDERDTESSEESAIVNQELAKRVGIGARIRVNGRMARVVGIARQAKYFDLLESPQPHLYLPFSQKFAARMVLHAEVDEGAKQVAALRGAIREIDPEMAVSEAGPLKRSIEQGTMFSARAAGDVIGVIEVCAIALALGGVYAMIAQYAVRKRREMGIRAALGSSRAELIAWLTRDAAMLIAAGTAGAIIAGVVADRMLASAIPGVAGFDWVAVCSAGGVAGMAAVAAWIPSARAARINPIVLLRSE